MSHSRVSLLLLIAAGLGLVSGCGGSDGSGSPTTPDPVLSISIDAPANAATVRGMVSILADVGGSDRPSSSAGAGAFAANVTFLVDGNVVGSSGGPTYAITWDSSTATNGVHTLVARAEDNGNSATDQISLVVDNPGGGVAVAVLPSEVSLTEGGSQQFTASVAGSTIETVVWSVDGGNTNGSISAAGLYTAPATFPTNATATIRATWTEDAGISGGATVSFDRGEQEVAVRVDPGTAAIAVGQTQAFTATVTGTTNTGVSWQVVGGTGNGSISAAGLYTAPATIPNPPTVTIRATSIEDGSKSADATVTVTAASALPAEQVELLGDTFRAGWTIQDSIREANELLARAVFFAGQLTGTLTQIGNTEEFQFSNQPSDRLRVVFTAGETVEIVISQFQGNTDGDWEDFLRAHAIAYSFLTSALDVQVTSSRIPGEFETDVNQTVQGTADIEGVTWNLQGQILGTEIFFTTETSATTNDTHNIQGLLTAGARRVEISHVSKYRNEFYSQSGNSFINYDDTIGSGGTDGTVTLVFDDVLYSSSDTEDREPIYQAEGAIGRNGALLGSLVTDSASGQVGIQLTTGEIVPF